MKRIFSALAVALATLLVIGGDAVVNFGGAAASMTDAAPAVPLTVASVSALPTGTTEPSPETALFSGLLGAAALTAHPGGETAEDALLNNEDAAKAAAAQAAEEEPPQETPEADEAPVSTAVQALGVISGTGVRMRSGAGTGYDILKTLDKGAVIELTAQEGDWYRISFDGKRGYVAAQYVTRYDTASGLNGAGRVTADVLNIRTAAKSGSTSLGTVSQGTVIAVTGIEPGGWFAVTYNGISGYVASQYVLICPTSALTGPVAKSGSLLSDRTAETERYGDIDRNGNGVTADIHRRLYLQRHLRRLRSDAHEILHGIEGGSRRIARKQTRYIEFHPYREDAAVLRIDANPLTDTAGSKPYPVYFQNVIHGTYLRRR